MSAGSCLGSPPHELWFRKPVPTIAASSHAIFKCCTLYKNILESNKPMNIKPAHTPVQRHERTDRCSLATFPWKNNHPRGENSKMMRRLGRYGRPKPPAGWEVICPTLEALEAEMREGRMIHLNTTDLILVAVQPISHDYISCEQSAWGSEKDRVAMANPPNKLATFTLRLRYVLHIQVIKIFSMDDCLMLKYAIVGASEAV